MNKKILTLCLVHKHPKILLGMKKRGFGEGKWNGFGGKVDKDETIEDAAIREMQEEANIFIEDMEKTGILDFEFKGNPEILEVHIFRVKKFSGEPMETEEMKPEWYEVDKIPVKDMWPDDEYWLPLFLENKKFRGKFLFDGSEENNILESFLEETEDLF